MSPSIPYPPPPSKKKVQGANAFILDTSRLTIGTVTVDGARARWVQHRRHKVYGSALEIKLPGSGNGSSGTGESGAGYSRGQLLKVLSADGIVSCMDLAVRVGCLVIK